MERVWSTSRRGFSARSILMFVLTVFTAALLLVTFGSNTTTHAADQPVTWKGASILYNGNQYFSAGDAKTGDSIGLPQGTHYYVYTSDTSNNGTAPTNTKAFVIYFAPGTDPPTATTATFVTYDYSSTKTFSNPTSTLTIAATPSGNESTYSSCTIQGIGWIICPLTVFLADTMDNIFNVIKQLFVVTPVSTTSSNNDLYIAWNIMRSFANVAFIIVFLIIIYSQLTNAGISNYGLKKLLPRLILGAVLVNLSYLICSVGVDISNVLGYSMQDIFTSIRQKTFNISNDTWSSSTGMGWQAVAAFVLSGGAATGVFLIAAGATIGASIYLIVPILVGLIATVFVVLLILAARQAIIIILIVIAPLAFVASLLPNTEQWFKKWRDLFIKMLIFFPAFSLVFGGAQLAGGIIIQNATSIIGIIFGMAVQVAPLAITPLLLKLSGGLLGSIANIARNQSKGLVGLTKKWSSPRAERHRQRGIGGDLKKRNFARRAARRLAYSNDRVERDTNRYKAGFEENANKRAVGTKAGQKIEVDTALKKLGTEEIHNDLGRAVQELRAGDASGLDRLSMTHREQSTAESLRLSKAGQTLFGETSLEQIRVPRPFDPENIGPADGDSRRVRRQKKVVESVIQRAVHLDQSSRVIANATASAQGIQQKRFAEAIDASVDLQIAAGGIDQNGAQRALANAFAVLSKARAETIDNADKIIDYRNLSNAQVRSISEGQVPAGINIRMSQDIRAAAIKRTFGGADSEQLALAMRNMDFSFRDQDISDKDRKELQIITATALEGNSSRPPEITAGVIGLMKQGLAYDNTAFTGALGKQGNNQMIFNAINNEKLDAGKLQSAGKDYSMAILNMLDDPLLASNLTDNAKKRLLLELTTVLDPTREASERLGDSKPFLKKIQDRLR